MMKKSFLVERPSIWMHMTMIFIFMSLVCPLFAQSGNWDSFGTTGTTGYTDYGNGVIQLVDKTASGCAGAAVHETTDTYNPVTDGTFSKCYEVFLGCPGDDDIGSDTKGDGLAFSFSDCAWSVGTCGGGLGYQNACANMITIEFDTWSSQGTASFDGSYEGTGNEDEITIQVYGDPEDWNKIAGENAGNLEDGREHTICITYDPSTDILSVTIDGTTAISHDLTGSGYELETYFGSVGLNQSWSSGKNGATNPATVSHGQDISDQIGSALCNEGVYISGPSASSVFSSCDGITIDSDVIQPYGETIDSVEFFIDGSKIGTDLTESYTLLYNPSDQGNQTITSTAYFSDGSDLTSDPLSIVVGGKIEETGSAPTINGHAEAIWDQFLPINLEQGYNIAPDLAANYKIAYDATNLYILITITDDVSVDDSGDDWDDDGIELYIDVNNDKLGAYGANDYQYSLPLGGSVSEYKHSPGSLTGVLYGDSSFAGGYSLEIALPWSTIGGGSPSGGDLVGFDIFVNDDDDGGGRDNQLAWNDGSFNAWSNPGLFGTQEYSDCVVLPMQLIYFEGHYTSSGNQLDWLTVHETQGNTQIIQRSMDLLSWESIGEVIGSSTRTSTNEYQFIDPTPSSTPVYYRIIQHSDQYKTQTSAIISVEPYGEITTLYPTHFSDQIEIMTPYAGQGCITIYDLLGRLIWQKEIVFSEASTKIRPPVSAGNYLLSATQDGRRILQERIVKTDK